MTLGTLLARLDFIWNTILWLRQWERNMTFHGWKIVIVEYVDWFRGKTDGVR